MRLLALALLALAVGCSLPAPATDDVVTVDVHGSDATLRSAEVAAAEWNRCAGVSIVIGRHNGGIPLDDVCVIAEKPGAGGVTDIDRGHAVDIEIVDEDASRDYLIAHELGHALGLLHAPHGLMAAIDSGEERDHHVSDAECAAILALK